MSDESNKKYTNNEMMEYIEALVFDDVMEESTKIIEIEQLFYNIEKDIPSTSTDMSMVMEEIDKFLKENRLNSTKKKTINSQVNTADCSQSNRTPKMRNLMKMSKPKNVRRKSSTKNTEEVIVIDLCNEEHNQNDVINISDVNINHDSDVIVIEDDSTPKKNYLSINSPEAVTKKFLGDCPVCWEDLNKKEIMSTICGHIFCQSCIKQVIKTTKRCPQCRKVLTLKRIHPLFL